MPSADALRTALVFDFGLKHIGVATAQESMGFAQALTTIGADDGQPHWADMDALIAEWHPHILVIGLPINMDGTPSEMAARAHRFGSRLEARYALATEYVDERLSTFEAESRLGDADAKRPRTSRRRAADKRRNKDIHAEAAKVIAETWLRR